LVVAALGVTQGTAALGVLKTGLVVLDQAAVAVAALGVKVLISEILWVALAAVWVC
jgi:hypothetical protein